MSIRAGEDPLRSRLRDSGSAFGAWTALGSAFAAELCVDCGFDYVCIDLQHGAGGHDSLENLMRASTGAHTSPLVRVGQDSPEHIGLALDMGASGVIVPMVNTAAQARRAVRSARYPPRGDRSFGPTRARLHLNQGRTLAEVDDEVMCFAMIETAEAVSNAAEICAVPGLTGVYVGPSDLMVDLGEAPRQDSMSAAVHRAIETVRDASLEHGVVAGIHAATGALARRFREDGFQMISIGTDAAVFRAAYARELAVAGGKLIES